MLMAMREHRDDGYWLSPSSAYHCPRQRILKMTEPYYQDLEGSWAPFIGNGVHAVLADAVKNQRSPLEETQKGMMPEAWKFLDLEFSLRDGTPGKLRMQGTPDLVDLPNAAIYDYKTIGDFAYFDTETKQRVTRVFPTPEHELQINLYALMYNWEHPLIENLFIWYAKSEGKKGAARRVVRVPLWDKEDAYHTACELAEPIAWAEHTGTLPTNCYDETDWRCRYCPVKEACQRLAAEGR